MYNRLKFRDRLAFAVRRLSGVPVTTDLSRYEAIAREALASDLRGATDPELQRRYESLRARLAGDGAARGARFSAAEAFALAAEACRRRLGLEPYERQLVAAAALCEGNVVQMQTGEGKTLAAAIAASCLAMRDGGLHVITANDYLAKRDAEWMGPIYAALGLRAAAIRGGDLPSARRSAYEADVLYVTSRELGFDYLRDGLAYERSALVQRGFRSAIVDEADFILIDEARVPLVIAAEPPAGPQGLERDAGTATEIEDADRAARSLVCEVDYHIDPERRRLSLTLAGRARLESLLGGGIHEAEMAPHFARVHASLEAHRLITRDVEYLVQDGRIKLIDAFTGRVAEDRRWPWGVQAALEAKEGLVPGPEGRIYGSITVQHLMGLYPRLAAMTATAAPAAGEFAAVYGMGTVIVPPVRPSRRRDEEDLVFWDRSSRTRAVIEEIGAEHGRGRPILAGTSSVRESEELARELQGRGIDCVVLNARNDAVEAEAIAAAGARGAVTISTDMSGRGTDIKLDGDPRLLELGGLYVIGLGRRESRRMDDQLRGRAGRQGDPGSTRFFVSLEDELFVRYGVRDFLPPRYRERKPGDAGLIEDRRAAREVDRAQATHGGRNAAMRLALRKYSLLVEYERRYVRALRDETLASGRLSQEIAAFLAQLDAAWAAHLAFVEDIKEGLALFRYGSLEPGMEFVRIVGEAFEEAMSLLEEKLAEPCRARQEGKAGPASDGLPLPSEAWTYAVEEESEGSFESLFRAK